MRSLYIVNCGNSPAVGESDSSRAFDPVNAATERLEDVIIPGLEDEQLPPYLRACAAADSDVIRQLAHAVSRSGDNSGSIA